MLQIHSRTFLHSDASTVRYTTETETADAAEMARSDQATAMGTARPPTDAKGRVKRVSRGGSRKGKLAAGDHSIVVFAT